MHNLKFPVITSTGVTEELGWVVESHSTHMRNSLSRMSKLMTTSIARYSFAPLSCKRLSCVLYRPPECPVLSFRNCLTFIDEYISMYYEDYQLSLFGDFNLPNICWSLNTIHPGGSSCSTESSHLLLDFMSEHLCTQVIL